VGARIRLRDGGVGLCARVDVRARIDIGGAVGFADGLDLADVLAGAIRGRVGARVDVRVRVSLEIRARVELADTVRIRGARIGIRHRRIAVGARSQDRKSTRLNSSHVKISYA